MMRKIIPSFDWKSMGIVAYVPLITSLLLIGVVALNDGSLIESMPAIELIFPIIGCWWSVFVLHDLLSENGSEVLFALPVRRWQLGLLKVLLFYFLYMIVMAAMLVIMSHWIGRNSAISLGVQLSAQSFFYAGLGFLAMVVTRNTGWSLIVVTSYLSFELLTTRTSSHVIDIYLHNVKALPLSAMSFFLQKVWTLGVLLFINAQYLLSSTTRYK